MYILINVLTRAVMHSDIQGLQGVKRDDTFCLIEMLFPDNFGCGGGDTSFYSRLEYCALISFRTQ